MIAVAMRATFANVNNTAAETFDDFKLPYNAALTNFRLHNTNPALF